MQTWQKMQRIRFGKKCREKDIAKNVEDQILQKTRRDKVIVQRREKEKYNKEREREGEREKERYINVF